MAQTPASPLPEALALNALLTAPPVPLDFVLPGLLRGTVGGLVTPGGVGKSYWALTVALSVALGPEHDISGLTPPAGKVLLLAAEDPQDVFQSRLQAYAPYLPAGADLSALDVRLCGDRDMNLMHDDCFAAIAEAATGCRLVILDTLTRFHALDENAAPDMKRLLGRMEALARGSGAAVLYLHHTSKAAVLNGQGTLQQAARGSSVISDNARWVAYLAPMTALEARRLELPVPQDEYVRFNLSKQNYGAARPDQWYRRAAGGALVPVTFAGWVAQSPQPAAQLAPPAPEPAPAVPPAEAPRCPTATGAYDGKW